MKKTLYFEGAGSERCGGDVGNCRIRTAFTNDEGRKIYLELTEGAKIGNPEEKSINIDYAKYLDEGDTDIFGSHYWFKWPEPGAWTKENILEFVNEELQSSFDEIVVLPHLGGYRVFRDKSKKRKYGKYNFGDKYQMSKKLLNRRNEINTIVYNWEYAERAEDRKTNRHQFVHTPGYKIYPNYSLWVDEDKKYVLHLLRHYNGYNRHWTITTKDNSPQECFEKRHECKLGKFGC